MIALVLDNAGWHTAPNLVVPEGLRLAYLPPYSPELQPTEHLWPVLDEPLANQYFETLADLERVVANRCRGLDGDQLSLGTNFHWWPKPATPSSSARDRMSARPPHSVDYLHRALDCRSSRCRRRRHARATGRLSVVYSWSSVSNGDG